MKIPPSSASLCRSHPEGIFCFVQVLYLDSDSMPISFPDDFFESSAYLHKGSTFFPEIWKEGVSEARFDLKAHVQAGYKSKLPS
jgi:hypothetical protein